MKRKKLSLNKLRIARITNISEIRGGSTSSENTNTLSPESVPPFNCPSDSAENKSLGFEC